MALRPRRGKYMPIEVPPEVVDSDSSSTSEVSSKASMGRTAFVTGKTQVGGKKLRIDDSSDEYDRISELSGVGDDDDDLRPPPTPRVTKDGGLSQSQPLDPQDYERMYTELIDKCKSLEGVTRLDENFQDDLSKNIQKGKDLFESLMMGSVNESNNASNRRKKGGAIEMYLAFLHTKITSNIVRNRAECIGTGPSIFSVEEFLAQMQKEYVDGSGTYSPHIASVNIARDASAYSKTLHPLVAMIGTFDRDAQILPKVIKPRAPRAKHVEPPEGAVGDDSQDALALVETDPDNDDLAKDINKIIKAHTREKSDPLNFYEFVLDRSSFPRTVENIFYTSFLVKDGHVSLVKDDPGKLKDLSLTIQPEESSTKNNSRNEDDNRNQIHRQKYIMSFSPRLWKNLCEMSQGEDIIKNYMAVMAADPNALPD